MTETRILGIDPGLNITGYGVLAIRDGQISLVEAGVVRSVRSQDLGQRLGEYLRRPERSHRIADPGLRRLGRTLQSLRTTQNRDYHGPRSRRHLPGRRQTSAARLPLLGDASQKNPDGEWSSPEIASANGGHPASQSFGNSRAARCSRCLGHCPLPLLFVTQTCLSFLTENRTLITKITGNLVSLTDTEATIAVAPFEYEVLVPDFTRRQLQMEIGNPSACTRSNTLMETCKRADA